MTAALSLTPPTTAVRTPSTPAAACAAAAACPAGTSTSMGVSTPVPTPRLLQLRQRLERRSAAGQRRGVGLPDLQPGDRGDQQPEQQQRDAGGDPAVPDDGAGPGRPPTRGDALLAQPRPVDARADPGEQRRQQREDHRDADQRDEHAAEAHAAQERHRHDDQRDQADRDGHPGGQHGVPGGLHRHDHRLLVGGGRARAPPASGTPAAASSRSRRRDRPAR